jgi:preprotein translocase subunit SecG
MYTILLVIHVLITLAMIVIILMQRSTGGLGGMGGGNSGGGLVSSRGQANLLTRTTAILATLFILNSLALSWLTQQEAPSRSIAEEIQQKQQEMQLQVPTPEEESQPVEAPKTEPEVPAADAMDEATQSLSVPKPE